MSTPTTGNSLGQIMQTGFSEKAPIFSAPGQGSRSRSATFSYDEQANLANEDTPVAIVFGKMFVQGNIINLFSDRRGEADFSGMLLSVCEGPVKSIAGAVADGDNISISALGRNVLLNGAAAGESIAYSERKKKVFPKGSDAADPVGTSKTDWTPKPALTTIFKIHNTIVVQGTQHISITGILHAGKKGPKVSIRIVPEYLDGTSAHKNLEASCPSSKSGFEIMLPLHGIDQTQESLVLKVEMKVQDSIRPGRILKYRVFKHFSDFGASVRLGTNDQELIDAHNRTQVIIPVGGEKLPITPNNPYRVTTQGLAVSKLVLRINFPDGLFRQRNNSRKSLQVVVLIEYRLHSAGLNDRWEKQAYVKKANKRGAFDEVIVIPFLDTSEQVAPGQYDVKVYRKTKLVDNTWFTSTGEGAHTEIRIVPRVNLWVDSQGNPTPANAPGATFWGYIPAHEEYVEVPSSLKYTEQTIKDSGVIEVEAIVEETISGHIYPNLALFGVTGDKVQLADRRPSLQLIVEGLLVDVYNSTTSVWSFEYSRNNIWCARYLLLNKRFGLGNIVVESEIDLDSFSEAADHCDEEITITHIDEEGGETVITQPRFRLNTIIDSRIGGETSIREILAVCRSRLVWSGGKFRIVMDKAETPTAMFCGANIRRGSLSIDYSPYKNIFNQTAIQFLDESKEFQRSTVLARDEDILPTGTNRRNTLFFPGITSAGQAFLMAHYLTQSQALSRAISFVTGSNGLSLAVGEVMYFAHATPGWGVYNGRVSGGGITSITLRDRVVLAPATSYTITVRFSTGQIVVRDISSSDGTYEPGDLISVSSAWFLTGAYIGSAPEDFDMYAIASAATGLEQFRVTDINRTPDSEVEIQALEYNPAVYAEDGLEVPVDSQTILPHPNAAPRHVTGLAAITGTDDASSVLVVWKPPSDLEFFNDNSEPESTDFFGRFSHVIVQRSSNDQETYDEVGTSKLSSLLISNCTQGVEYWFRVISVSTQGVQANEATAPRISGTVQPPLAPQIVSGLELVNATLPNGTIYQDLTAVFRWTRNNPSSLRNVAGAEGGEAGQTEPNPFFSHFIVAVHSPTALLRRETTVGTDYSYSVDMNTFDHSGTASREFTFAVAEVDIFGQVGQYAYLKVTNPTPDQIDFTLIIQHTPISGITVWISNEHIDALDFREYYVYRSTVQGFTPATENLVLRGVSQDFIQGDIPPYAGVWFGYLVDFSILALTTYYYRVAAVDLFGDSDLIYTDEQSITTVGAPPGGSPVLP